MKKKPFFNDYSTQARRTHLYQKRSVQKVQQEYHANEVLPIDDESQDFDNAAVIGTSTANTTF
jgi:hypothetical protein